jgi:hypothetical protein
MPHHLRTACFNCGASINTSPAKGDSYALYTSKVEYLSPQGVTIRSSVVRRLVCASCGEFAELHPVRFPSPVVEA